MGAGTTNPEYFDFERYATLEGYAYDVLAILEELHVSSFLNTDDYFGGFEQEDIDQLCGAMESNYQAWCSGFAPLVVGGDMDSVAVQELSRTLFSMRPDIALSSSKDLAVPVFISEYLHRILGGKSVVEIIVVEGHLPQLSSPEVTVPVLLRHIRC
ncbi:hypothetical protein RJ639_034944 [Escallonia herrerae]|uniref:Uncharacterized protein n=1 Tax=Escallonia herrerae TaxID=1293975 RepID=A0AA89BIF1_9ASTE|nr:hypothetical protein RJ639_034944 [Escallonia herrerae]